MAKLGEIAEITMGQSPKGDSYNQDREGMPLLNGPTEFGLSHPVPNKWTTEVTRVCAEGDILFCVRGSTTGRMNWADQEYCIGRGLASLRARTGSTDTKFIYYSLVHNLDSMLSLAAGSVFPNLSRSDLEGFEIHWPSPDVREDVVDNLGSLDEKIELNRRMNQTLEDIARAIFKSWFVDFDPVRARMEGRDPGLPAEITSLFPDSFEDSPLGEIPKGWRTIHFPEVIEVNPARHLKKGQAAPYLEMQNMPVSGHRPLGWTTRPYSSGSRFKNGDTLLARITPCLENGKTAFVDFLEDEETGWGSTEYIVIRPKPPFPVEYGYCLARSNDLRDHAIQNMTGTSGRQRVPISCFDNFVVRIPPIPILRYFGFLTNELLRQTRYYDEQSKVLSKIRNSLLYNLFG